jgi:hypothetical protein
MRILLKVVPLVGPSIRKLVLPHWCSPSTRRNRAISRSRPAPSAACRRPAYLPAKVSTCEPLPLYHSTASLDQTCQPHMPIPSHLAPSPRPTQLCPLKRRHTPGLPLPQQITRNRIHLRHRFAILEPRKHRHVLPRLEIHVRVRCRSSGLFRQAGEEFVAFGDGEARHVCHFAQAELRGGFFVTGLGGTFAREGDGERCWARHGGWVVRGLEGRCAYGWRI